MTLLKYPGSKEQCAPWIINHFPEGYRKMTYLEPFFGSGRVFFQKARSVVETINDLDKLVVNLFCQIRENHQELIYAIENTPWSREEYNKSKLISDEQGVEAARQFLVAAWMSIGARIHKGNYSWRNNIAGNNGNLSAWSTKLPEVITVASQRLKSTNGCIVQIENQDALQLIERYNRDNVLMYIDPPYVMSTRASKIYRHEYNDDDHYKLLQSIKCSNANIIISGYDNELYNTELKHWRKESKAVRVEGGKVKTEYIWINYLTATPSLFSENQSGLQLEDFEHKYHAQEST